MHPQGSELDVVYHVASVPQDSARFRGAAEWVRKRFGLRRILASISIVDDETIHRLNRQYLDHDWPTDVISFVFDAQNQEVSGEIIASLDTARKMHAAAGWELADELLLYVVHGLLHLAGMDDDTERNRRAMRLAERECLLDLGVTAAENHLERWNDITYWSNGASTEDA